MISQPAWAEKGRTGKSKEKEERTYKYSMGYDHKPYRTFLFKKGAKSPMGTKRKNRKVMIREEGRGEASRL